MTQALLGLCISIAIGCVASISIQFAVADYYYEQAKDSFDKIDLKTIVRSDELAPHLDAVDKALGWRARHVDALDFKGDLFYQSWLISSDGRYVSDSELLQQAISHHVKALSIRKNWVFSFARLALIYSHQVELDSQFDYWFRESHRLGVNETEVARSLMMVGLKNWKKLSNDQRSLTMDFIEASIEKKSISIRWLSELLQFYELYSRVCAEFRSTPRKDQVCSWGL